MSDVSKYIKIEFVRMSPSGKTKIWHVRNTQKADDVPGIIAWNGGWRKYVYYSYDAYYDWDCLRMIADFIETATKEHRKKGVKNG